jgi:hypothetical protein
VITGFNTDIEHDGVVYHVQTEDKGLASPLILSLVYSGGAILASKRSPYKDLIAAGFDEEKLSQRVKHQHRLICAAITAGRIEELKRMGGVRAENGEKFRPPARPPQEVDNQMVIETSAERPPVAEETLDMFLSSEDDDTLPDLPALPQPQDRAQPEESAYTVYDPRRKSPKKAAEESQSGLLLTILGEREFFAGENFAIRILLQNRSGNKEKAVSGVTLSLKILGTTFRPAIFSVKTGRDGVGVVSGRIPYFESGRAAIVISAVADGSTAELRRVIHPAT